ncbi:ATP synthase gamma chain [Dirofilaria immitis]
MESLYSLTFFSNRMRNEIRISAVVSVVMIGVLAVVGIIGYAIIKRRRKGVETIKTAQECEALQKYLETCVEIDQGIIDVNVNPRSRQKLMSTKSRHRKERNCLPVNSKRVRFNKFQSSGQQMSNTDDEKR